MVDSGRLSALEHKFEQMSKENNELKDKIIALEKDNYELNKKVEDWEKIINSRVPIYRSCNGIDHFYCYEDEFKSAQANYGYQYEGIQFYAFTSPGKKI